MPPRSKPVARLLSFGVIALAAGILGSVEAGSRQAVPRAGGGGGGHRAPAPAYHGGAARAPAAPRGAPPPRGYAAPRGTANGVAHYGYGYGGYGYGGYGYGGYYGGYPCWGWGIGYGWWGAGWYGGWWGWPYAYGGYWPYYGAYYGGGYGPDTSYVSEAPAPSGPAIIETGVTPSKAVVLLDGDNVGYASDYNGRWDELTVAPGPHTVAFQMSGYRSLVISLDAKPGATYAFHDALVAGDGEDRRALPAAASPKAPEHPPEPSSPGPIGRLRVMAQPGDAAVYLDGEYLGLAAELGRIHGALAVPTGQHRLDAARPGFVTASRSIDVGATEVVTVELSLEPQP